MNKNIAEQGRSMIEMLGVLAIVGVLSIGGIAGYSKAMDKYRINKFVNQITQIIHNTQTLYGMQKNYEGLHCESGNDNNNNCNVLIKTKIVPEEMMEITDGELTAIKNPFNSTSWGISSRSSPYKAVNIFFSGNTSKIPTEACIDLLTYDWSAISGVIGIATSGYFNSGNTSPGDKSCSESTNTQYGLGACVGGTTIGIPVPVEKAVTACSGSNAYEFWIKFK